MKIFKSDPLKFTEDFPVMLKIIILNTLGFFFIGFLLPIIALVNMMASAIEISLIVSFQVFGRTLSGIITGYLTDKLRSKTSIVLIGSYGRGFSYFVIYVGIVMNSLFLLILGTFILGFMAGIFWVPFNTLVAEKSNKDNRSEAYGKVNSANAIGQIIGALFGFTLFTLASIYLNNSFLIYGAIPLFGIANFYAGLKFHKEVNEHTKFLEIDKNDDLENLKSKNIQYKSILIGSIFLMLVLLMSSINSSIARPFLNIYMYKFIESNIYLVYWAYLPAGLVATLLAPKVGILIDKMKPSIAITLTSSIGALVTWLLINSSNLWIFSFFLLFDLTISIAASLLFQNLLSRISIKHRGKSIGFGDFFTFLGNIIGPIIGGIAWDYLNPKAPFIISIFIELSLIPLYLIVIYYLIPFLSERYKAKDHESNLDVTA
jgi:MFS family permease